MRLTSFLVSLSILAGVTAIAQQSGPGSGPSPGSPGSQPGPTSPSMPGAGTTVPGRTNPFPGQDPNSRTPFPDMMQRPIFISGKVVLEDGTAPPESVTIERVCNGVVRPEGYTDSKGRFSIELGRNSAMMVDASNSGSLDDGLFGRTSTGTSRGSQMGGVGPARGISERELIGCEIRATLAGFRAEPVQMAGRRSLDNPELGTMILRRLANVEGFTFSATTALAPKESKKSYEKGLDLIKKKKLEEGTIELEKATGGYAKYAVAWYDLGRAYEMQQRPDDAVRAYESSIAADSKYVRPYVNLAFTAAQKKDWQKAADISAKGIRLNPVEYPQLYYFNAVANVQLGKLDDAEKSARDGIQADPKGTLPRLDHVLGVVLANKNDLKGAKESFANYLKKDPNSPVAQQVRTEMARLAAPAAPKPPAAGFRASPVQPGEADTDSPVPAGPAAPPAPVATALVAPAPAPAPAPAVTGRSAWPSWSSGISDLPPGTLSDSMETSELQKTVSASVYAVATALEAGMLKPESREFDGAAVAVSSNLLVTHCDSVEKGSAAAIYQNGKLVSNAVRVTKSKRQAGLCVLEVAGVRLQPVTGVRYAQDLSTGEKTFTFTGTGLGEGTLSAAKTQGGLKLIVATSPITSASAGGGLFDSFGNLIGVTTVRAPNTSIAVEEYYQ